MCKSEPVKAGSSDHAFSGSHPSLTRVSWERCTKAELGTGEKYGHEIPLSANLLMFPWLAGGQTRKQMVSRIGQERFNSLGRDRGSRRSWPHGQRPLPGATAKRQRLVHLFPDPGEWFWPCGIRNQKRQGQKKKEAQVPAECLCAEKSAAGQQWQPEPLPRPRTGPGTLVPGGPSSLQWLCP